MKRLQGLPDVIVGRYKARRTTTLITNTTAIYYIPICTFIITTPSEKKII